MTTTLEEQLADFVSLGEVFDPNASLEAKAVEVADVLMQSALVGGPLEWIGRLTNLLRVLKRVTKIVTERRDVAAYSANAIWPYRRLAKLVGVHVSTMQGWITAGRKAIAAWEVPRETASENSAANSNSNSELVPIQ